MKFRQLTQFDKWLKNLGKAWMEKDLQLIADICAEDVEYYETPYSKPYTSPEAVKKLWQEVPDNQKDIKFKYDILAAIILKERDRLWQKAFGAATAFAGVLLLS